MSLHGYDLVWAITQNTINSQMAWLQEEGLIAKSLAFGDLDADGSVIGGEGADAAVMAPPTVSFDTGQPNIIRLLLSFTGGTMTTYDGFGRNANQVKYPLAGCVLAFKVNVAIGQLAHEHLANGKAVPPEVYKILTAFDPSMFEVQSIFMDFENSDLTSYDSTYSVLPFTDDRIKVVFSQAMASWINSHKGSDNPFILGHAVTRNTPTAPGTPSILDPTGANFSSRVYTPITGSNDPNIGLSTFNFEMVTAGRKKAETRTLEIKSNVPNAMDDIVYMDGPDEGFAYNLVDTNDIDGRGYIALDTFLDTYIGPQIIDPLNAALTNMQDYVHARDDRSPNVEFNNKSNPDAAGRATFSRTQTGWTYFDEVHLNWHESGFNSHDRWSRQKLTFDVAMVTAPDSGGVPRLTLQVRGSMYRYEKDQLNTDIPPFKSNVYLGDAWAEATLPWTIEIQFIASQDGKLEIQKISRNDPTATDHGQGGAYDVGDVFSNILGLSTISDDWSSNAASLAKVEAMLAGLVNTAADNAIQAASTKIVMPAPKVFFYKNIRLGEHGDIEIDLTYKAA